MSAVPAVVPVLPVLPVLLVAVWLVALGRSGQPRGTRTPWSRLGLREGLSLARAGLVLLGRAGEMRFDQVTGRQADSET